MLIGTACDTGDVAYIQFFQKLKSEGLLDFLELHIKSNVTVNQLQDWGKTGLVKYIHAETGGMGEFMPKYLETAETSYNFLRTTGEILGVIVHMGLDKQNIDFKTIEFPEYVLLENMPYMSSFKEKMCGYLPETMCKNFVFDFAHAWMTAKKLNMKPREFILKFMDLKPRHFHLTDCLNELDHLVLGTGEIDLPWIMGVLPMDATLTIETDNIIKEYRKENIIKDLMSVRLKYEARCNNPSTT